MASPNSSNINFSIASVILVILILAGLYYLTRNQTMENFIVFLDDIVIPKTCPDYLVYNGHEYFLLNSRLVIDGTNNPKRFPNKPAAMEYLKSIQCPTTIPFVDLVQRKKTKDVTVSMDRECNRKIAPNLFDLDICGSYGSLSDSLTSQYLSRLNKIESDRTIYADYDRESCMIAKAVEDHPELDDSHFKADFQKYFDRLNSNIDEQFLYITGR